MTETPLGRYHAVQARLLQLVLEGKYASAEYEAATAEARVAWDALDAGEQEDVRAEVLKRSELTGEARPLTDGDTRTLEAP